MKERNPLRAAVQLALSASVAATVTTAPAAFAADDDVAEQDTVTVTGSRIRRVDVETPLPVTTISREDIDASGEISVAEVLRGSSFNSFGSFKQRSGSSAQSQSTVSLRGLGAQRTLVLLDGRRIAGSPTFGGGAAQNLNTIPLAAVERIEVLRDGASAVYGSDAIGGVINVILRKDYDGLHLSAGIGRPTQEGGDENSFGITGGISSGKGNVTFSFDHAEQEMIFNGDRTFSAVGVSGLGFPGTAFFDPSSGIDILTGMPFEDGVGYLADPDNSLPGFSVALDPRCPPGLDTDGDGFGDTPDPANAGSATQDSVIGVFFSGLPQCGFNYARTSANEASLERDSFFVTGNFELTDNVSMFARGILSKTESFGRYAPAPTTGFSMAADNPINFTAPGAVTLPAAFPRDWNEIRSNYEITSSDFSELDYNGDGVADARGPFTLTSVWFRNIPGGFRDSTVDNLWVDALVGLQGSNDWFGGSDWEVGVQHSRQTNDDTSQGLGIATFTQSAIDNGTFDVFGVNLTDINDPATRATAQGFGHTGFHNEETRTMLVDGVLSFDAAQMANGSVPIAIGFEYRDEKFAQDYDALQNAGRVFGSSGGDDLGGARVAYAVYGEVAIPILENLELDLKLRRDHYNDFGDATTPQLSVGFRPLDNLLLRASFGEGFRAPSMSELYTSRSQSFNDAVDFVACNTGSPGNVVRGGDGILTVTDSSLPGCVATQVENISGGNPNLKAEESEQFGLGVVWSPMADLTLSLDYYDIEVDNEVTTLPLNDIFDIEYAFLFEGAGDAGIAALVNRGSARPLVSLNNQNLEGIQTSGYDLGAAYSFSVGNVGDFGVNLQVSHVDEYLRRVLPTEPFRRLQQTFDVDTRANLALNWSRGDFGATVIGNHIGDTAYSDETAQLSSWTTWDLQLGYATPWNGKVVVGARNLFDRDPPLDTTGALGHPFYSNLLHDIYGRVPYLRYEQDL